MTLVSVCRCPGGASDYTQMGPSVVRYRSVVRDELLVATGRRSHDNDIECDPCGLERLKKQQRSAKPRIHRYSALAASDKG